ncbi:hypothetical protein AHF37_12599, partial [Paragonimus kellicotti]
MESDVVKQTIGATQSESVMKERVLLWRDLANAARRFQLWDVCTIACRFSLLYDQDQLFATVLNKMEKSKFV